MTCKLLKMALFYTYICLFEEKMQKIHFFCRYANKILILIGNVLIFELIFVLLSAFAPVHSLPNLKIYLFMSKFLCTFVLEKKKLQELIIYEYS